MTTDTTTSGAAATVEPDPDRVQHLDPRALVMTRQVRGDATPDKEMISSVRDYGVLQPITATVTADGRASVRFGHRRALAAIAAELDTVPVIVQPACALVAAHDAEIDRISKQFAENEHRRGLSVAAPSKNCIRCIIWQDWEQPREKV